MTESVNQCNITVLLNVTLLCCTFLNLQEESHDDSSDFASTIRIVPAEVLKNRE